MSANAHTERQRRLHSHLGPLWYCLTLSARSGPDALVENNHQSQCGRRTGVNPCDITFTFPPTDRIGPNPLVWRWIAGDLKAKHVDWNSRLTTRREKLLRDCADQHSCLICFRHPKHQPIQLLRYSLYLAHRDNEDTPIPVLSYFVLCNKLGPISGTHCHSSIILPLPNGSP
jgi:hypothetical protein